MEPRKQAIIDALRKFMNQRSGIEFGNYGDVKAFRAEQRAITKDLREARELMRAVELSDSITAGDLDKASRGAYGGRLTIRTSSNLNLPSGYMVHVDYCAGQYFPTEYRRAVCAVLASALWEYTREHCMPAVHGYRVEQWTRYEGTSKHTWQSNWITRKADADEHLASKGGEKFGHVTEGYRAGADILRAGDWLRAHFRQQFGRGIASRWFS